MKKAINITLVILFNLCLIWIAIAQSALSLASSKSFYQKEFKENGIYASYDSSGNETRKIIYYVGGSDDTHATLSDAQLNIIINHITDYLFENKESFELTLNNVYILGEGYRNGVSVFGEAAISHMQDVRALIKSVQISLTVTVILVVGIAVYFIFEKQSLKRRIFTYSRNFHFTLIALALGFCIWSYLGSSDEIPFTLNLWKNLHFLIFPFQPEKISGSVLRDSLTVILTTELFISATVTVLSVLIFTVITWLISAYFLEKRSLKLPK